MSQKNDKKEGKNLKRDLLALGLVAAVFVMQFFVIRFGIFGNEGPDPDEMTYKEKTQYASKNGLTNGPRKEDAEMTKADLALMMYRTAVPADQDEEASAKSEYTDGNGAAFKDVDEGDLSKDMKEAAYWCALHSVLYPVREGRFGAEDTVKVQDAVCTLARLAGYEKVTFSKPEEDPPEITDTKKASEYARDDIEEMEKTGVLKEFGSEIGPQENVTFGKMTDAAIRMRNALDADKKREADDYDPIPGLYGLKDVFKKTTKDFEGTWSMYIKCFDTGETLVIGNKQMVSASLIKLYVAGVYFDELKKGRIEENAGSKDDLHLMISESSNSAWEDLEKYTAGGSVSAGWAKVNRFAKAGGYDQTERHVQSKTGPGTANYTSVRDVGKVLDKLYFGKYVSKEASKRILGHMLEQVHVNKIPAGIPDGVKIANKTGELEGQEHDSAIVWTKNCTYALVIMTEGVNRAQIGYKNVADLSEAVYIYMTQ